MLLKMSELNANKPLSRRPKRRSLRSPRFGRRLSATLD
ncbi:MAG: hypothetical protein N838_20185 [Thiohalocapsa sp. PB-PSB1]|nr:MAG: hypothetical protein N838_20185 [Thiohalocapsa sp. PB-PSB1]